MSREKRWAAVEAAHSLGVARLDATIPCQHLTASIAVLLGWEKIETVSLGKRLLATGAMDTFEKLKVALLPFVEAAQEEETEKTSTPIFTDEQADLIFHALKDAMNGIRYDIGLFLNGADGHGSKALKSIALLYALRSDST